MNARRPSRTQRMLLVFVASLLGALGCGTTGTAVGEGRDTGGQDTSSSTDGGDVDTAPDAADGGGQDVGLDIPPDTITGICPLEPVDASPVTFRLVFTSDVDLSLWVQIGDVVGLPRWLTVRRDGEEIGLFDRCDVPHCDENTGICGAARPVARDLLHDGLRGEIELEWDGLVRRSPQSAVCYCRYPAEAGTYVAEFCMGAEVESEGEHPEEGLVFGEVRDVFCEEVEFTYPAADPVVLSTGFAD